MKEKLVPSWWLEKEGRRLDCGPYVSGAIEARVLLEALPVRRLPLSDLTENGPAGIFHAGRESRTYVDDPAFGTPFLSSSDILLSDLSYTPCISKRQAAATPKFIIREGWTLITRSGTIGRTVFSRSDMDGLACSEHVLRVVPDKKLIRPGYLYAFLSSRFGIPLIVGSTYGSIIRAIEPQHIVSLPVPLAPTSLQAAVDNLVSRAATARVEASRILEHAVARAMDAWGENPHAVERSYSSPDIVVRQSSQLNARFDAFYHSTRASNADAAVARMSEKMDVRALGDVVERVFETPRFGRIEVYDENYGAQFMSISDLARFDPVSTTLVSKKQVAAMQATVGAGWLILPRVGQVHGLFGHVVAIPPHLDGIAVSDNNIRIVPRSADDGGYLLAALSTAVCYWQIVRRACGTSIPYLDAARVRQVPIPWPAPSIRKAIAREVNSALASRSEAVAKEREAVHTVETWIENKGAA